LGVFGDAERVDEGQADMAWRGLGALGSGFVAFVAI
jgi:hypothetical protein